VGENMIAELIGFINMARQTFLGTVILVAVPTVVVLLLYVGLFGKPIPKGVCQCCGQKLPNMKPKRL
jgi:hypothetical protein